MGPGMSLSRLLRSSCWLCCGCLLAVTTLSGCQTQINGQTLPSPTYLRDDIQYFPAGPEFQLSNQVRALEEYKAAQGDCNDVGPVNP